MTTFKRRQILQGAAALPAAAALGAQATPARAEAHAAPQGASLYGAPLGNYRITALLDGIAPLGRNFFFGSDEIDPLLERTGLGPDLLPAPVSAFLLQSDDRTILIDAGMGEQELLGPGFGGVSPALAAAGVAPEDVDTILLTHAHPDHLGGLISGGSAVFANAELVVAETEAAFWTDDGIQSQAPEESQGLFQLAQSVLGAYGDQVTRVADGADVAPGISLMLSPGHTPGHSVLMIDGGDRQMLMLADTLHSAEVHTALPDVGFGFDSDPAQAATSRRRIFDMVATDKMLIAGTHLHFPGFGRILTDGDAYRYLPATWG